MAPAHRGTRLVVVTGTVLAGLALLQTARQLFVLPAETGTGHAAPLPSPGLRRPGPPREDGTGPAGLGCTASATSLALAALAATSAALSRFGRRLPHAARAPELSGRRAEQETQGSVEGVRILGGWASSAPGASSGIVHQALSDCRVEVVGEGVAQMSFVVDSKHTSGYVEEFELGKGTTENSYILFDPEDGLDGDGPLLLVDVPERRFSEAFVEKIGPYMKRFTGLVVTSIDEENAPVLASFTQEHQGSGAASKLHVYCSTPGVQIIKNLIDDKEVLAQIDLRKITDDDYIPLPCKTPQESGAPHLDVVDTANPKVPESMGVFDERTGMLFSGKLFGAHVAAPATNPSWEDLAEDWHHFFDCYFFTENAHEAIRRIFQIAADNAPDGLGLRSADVTSLAPRHGPVVTQETWKLMAKYEGWLERKLSVVNEGTALVLFASAYGNTTDMARAIQRGIEETGVKTNMVNCEFTDAQDIKAAYEQCQGVAIGSPTLGGQMPIQMKEALGVILNAAQQGNQQAASVRRDSASSSRVPAGVFGSFGWSGEAVDEVYLRLKDAGFEFAFDPIRCKFKPTDKVIGECEAAGTRLAQKMNEARKEREEAISEKLSERLEKTEASDGMMRAFGQLINSSCVLTMVPQEGQPELRMPVSWVSQASFTPPGIMLALEKENLDPFLQLPMDEQLTILFEKYDVDSSGQLDKGECDPLFDELFGVEVGSVASEMLRGQKEDAWKLLDADGSGEVDCDEFKAAASSGPLAELLARQRKVASLEASLSGSVDAAPMQFTLSMLPQGMSAAEAMEAELAAKPKPKNGCPAIKGATAFVECSIKGLMNAGRGTVLYADVKGGEVVDKQGVTELLRADHIPIPLETTDA